MRSTLMAFLLVLMAVPAAAAPNANANANAQANASSPDLEQSYIVVLDPDFPGTEALAAAWGLTPTHVYSNAFNGFAAHIPAAALQGISRNPHVLFVQEDAVLTAVAQSLPTGVDRIDGELNATAAIDGVDTRVDVDVAVIDSGIDLNHPDLNVVGDVSFMTRSGDDDNGHGTHCAGTIGALDNGTGVVGVAPGARLWAVKVLNRRGSGSTSDIAAGIDWVTARADTIEIASMSLGGTGIDDGNCGLTNGDAMHLAVCNAVAAGITFVVAAGNESDNAANHVPAAYDEVITVSALADFDGIPGGFGAPTCRSDVDDTLADFSNFGADVDIMAPGVCIESTWKGGGYNTISGTSMACPHVSGAAALFAAENPGATPAEVKAGLLAQALPFVASDDPDGIHEPLLYVGTPAEIHDLAVTGVAAPATAAVGDFLVIDVTVANTGAFDETATVTLTDGASVLGTDSVVLLAGDSTVVSFGWDTTFAAGGAHSLTGTVALSGDEAPANDSASTTVSLITPTHDVAVAGVSAPASAAPGDAVLVAVSLANEGTYDETFALTLTDSYDGTVIGSRSVTLGAGLSGTENFTWDTTSVFETDHVLVAEASVVAGETDTADNSGSTTVAVAATVPLSCTVVTDAPSYSNRDTVVFTIHAFDANGSVAGLGAAITVTTPKNKIYSGSSATTDGGGNASYSFGTNTNKDGTGTYTMDATVSGSGYDSATCSGTFTVN